MRKENDNFFIVDDSLRLDLIGISLLPVQVKKINYSCYYGLATLYFVSYKYLATLNESYKKYLLDKYSNDIEKYFIL